MVVEKMDLTQGQILSSGQWPTISKPKIKPMHGDRITSFIMEFKAHKCVMFLITCLIKNEGHDSKCFHCILKWVRFLQRPDSIFYAF